MTTRYWFLEYMRSLSRKFISSGYDHEFVNDKMETITTIIIVLPIVIILSPLFVVIGLLIKVQDGGPVFYRGRRYGKGKKEFIMYKFRTLVPDAEAIIGAQLLKPEMKLVTSIGCFLRDTRLDELPQLINVLKGDMVLIGPRPERPAVYSKLCQKIPNYDKRFEVKPGLIGFSQVFTPHGTDKRIRKRIDNGALKHDRRIVSHLMFFGFTIFWLGLGVLEKATRIIFVKANVYIRTHRLRDLRVNRRVKTLCLSRGEIKIQKNGSGSSLNLTQVMDIDSHYMSVLTENRIPSLQSGNIYYARLIFYIRQYCLDRRTKRVVVYCYIDKVSRLKYRNDKLSPNYRFLIRYQAASSFDHYKIEKYILKGSIL